MTTVNQSDETHLEWNRQLSGPEYEFPCRCLLSIEKKQAPAVVNEYGGNRVMAKGRYGGPERRRSARHDRRFSVILEYEGETHEIRTIDISEHGIHIPKRIPPPIETRVKLTLAINDELSIFKGVVVRHTKCLVNGAQAVGIGIDFFSPEYQKLVKDKISLA